MAVETRYFCTGTCGAVVTQEEYNNGLRGCGEESCSMHTKPFEKGLYCTICKKRIQEKQRDDHNH